MRKLTSQAMAVFVGGDLQISDCQGLRLFGGPIKNVTVTEDGQITVELEWRARNNGIVANPTAEWTLDKNCPVTAKQYSFSWHASGTIVMDVSNTREVLVFSLPGRDPLDRSLVANFC